MRAKATVFLLACLMVCLFTITTLAQAEKPKTQLYMVFELVTKPSMAKDYENAVKEEFALLEECKFPHPWYVYSTDDFHYYFFSPMDNFASIDEMDKSYAEMAKKIGKQRWQAVMKRIDDKSEYYHMYMIRYKPDLSYTPENPRLKPEDANFISIDFYYIQPGKEKEFEEVCKDYNALDKRKKIPNDYSFSVMAIGTEMPLYIGLARGRNASDLFSHWEKQQEIEGEEGKVLWEKTWAVCRKFETKTGWFRPDLSYIPEKK